MFKTFALTVVLAVSSAFIGYNLDTVAGTALQIRAYMQGTAIDPKQAFWHCYEANDANAMACQPQAQAWAARDGADALVQIARGMTTRELANYPR